MLGAVVDVFRLRQYFDLLTRARDLAAGVREDRRLLGAVGRAVVATASAPGPVRPAADPFPPREAPVAPLPADRPSTCAAWRAPPPWP